MRTGHNLSRPDTREVDPLSSADRSRLAALHCECLPDSLVSELGRGYAEAFYRYVSRSPEEWVFVLREGERIISGCVLSLSPKTLRRRLLLHTPLLLYAVPWALGRLGRKQAKVHSGPSAQTGQDPVPSHLPELILVFTSPECRSRGAGAALIAQCERSLAAQGYSEYLVRTVDDESNRALKFYIRHGFVPFAQSVAHGHTFRIFRKPVPRS